MILFDLLVQDPDDWDPRRWKTEHLQQVLKERKISYHESMKRDELVSLVKENMYFETLEVLTPQKEVNIEDCELNMDSTLR